MTGDNGRPADDDSKAGPEKGRKRRALNPAAIISDWTRAIVIATRVLASPPFRLAGLSFPELEEGELARMSRGFPVAGLAVGLLAGLAYAVAAIFNLPAVIAAIFAVAAIAFLGGASSEGGLARAAEALVSGSSQSKRLKILKADSLGAYGLLSLILSVGLRIAAIAAIGLAGEGGGAGAVTAALAAALAASWGILPAILYLVPSAKSTGFVAQAGKPKLDQAILAAALGGAIAFLFLGPLVGLVALAVGAAGAFKFMWLARRQFGGLTGDLLGAAQQGAEIGILLAVVAMR